MSMFRTPVSPSAFITALTKAAGPPTAAHSPIPLAPIGWCGHGVTTSLCSSKPVVHVVGADAVAVGVERDELHAGHGVGLGQAAHDLALDDHRVDPDPAVVDRDHPQHVPDAGLRVDLDGDDVDGKRPGEVGG